MTEDYAATIVWAYTLVVFFMGGAVLSAFQKFLLEPWARRRAGRHLACDYWGLEDE